jgi:hypothetical protein
MTRKRFVITCMDPRLHQKLDGTNCIAQFCLKEGFEPFLISIKGCIRSFVETESVQSYVLEMIETAIKHGAEGGDIISHEDCRGYPDFQSREEDIECHLKYLSKAEEIIDKVCPSKPIRIFIAELESGSREYFNIGKEETPLV